MPHFNKEVFKSYYVNQAKQHGGNLPAFHGATVQHGYGLGSILKGLFRWAIPHISTGAKSLGRQALKGGLAVAQDVVEMKNFKDSLQSRAKQTLSNIKPSNQSGAGKRSTKRRRQGKSTSVSRAKKTKTSKAKGTPKFGFFQNNY